ncbi:hypothetical protein TUBRATIS_22400, partial [Tubulinosema ratisbonensis]
AQAEFEFLKENILFEIMKDKRDFTKSNTLNSFLLGTKVLILLMIYNNFTDKMYDSLVLQLTISSFFIFLRIFNLKYANMFVLNDVYLLKNIGPPGFYASFEVKRAVYCGSKRILGIENPVSMNFKSLIYLKNTKSIFEVLYESISCKNLKKECYCFSIEKNCLCEENNLKFIRGMDSKTLLISIKVFHRRILEIKEMLKTQINTNSQRFISLKIEEFMRIFFDLTLSFLSYNED